MDTRVKADSEGGVLGEGQQPPPHHLGGLGSIASSPAGFRAEPRLPKGFPLFSALRMASPDTTILLIVDYHAAIGGGKTPVPSPLAHAPGWTSYATQLQMAKHRHCQHDPHWSITSYQHYSVLPRRPATMRSRLAEYTHIMCTVQGSCARRPKKFNAFQGLFIQ